MMWPLPCLHFTSFFFITPNILNDCYLLQKANFVSAGLFPSNFELCKLRWMIYNVELQVAYENATYR